MFDHGNHDHSSQHAATPQLARPRPPKRKDVLAPHTRRSARVRFLAMTAVLLAFAGLGTLRVSWIGTAGANRMLAASGPALLTALECAVGPFLWSVLARWILSPRGEGQEKVVRFGQTALSAGLLVIAYLALLPYARGFAQRLALEWPAYSSEILGVPSDFPLRDPGKVTLPIVAVFTGVFWWHVVGVSCGAHEHRSDGKRRVLRRPRRTFLLATSTSAGAFVGVVGLMYIITRLAALAGLSDTSILFVQYVVSGVLLVLHCELFSRIWLSDALRHHEVCP